MRDDRKAVIDLEAVASKANAIETADAWFAALPQLKRSVVGYTQLLHVQSVSLAKAFLAGDAEGLSKWTQVMERTFAQMGADKVAPNVVTFGTLAWARARVNDLEGSRRWVDAALAAEGIRPNEQLFTALAYAYCATGRYKEVSEVLTQMEVEDVKPNSFFASIAIQGAIRARDYEHAWAVFRSLRHRGVAPDTVTFTDMIHCCAKERKAERALTLLDEMNELQLVVTDATYNAVIGAVATRVTLENRRHDVPIPPPDDFFDQAFMAAQQLRANGFKATGPTYSGLLKACARSGDSVVALSLFRAAVNDGVANMVHASQLIDVLVWKIMQSSNKVHAKMIAEAERLYSEIIPQLWPKEPVSVFVANSMLRVYTCARRPKLAEEFFAKEYALHSLPRGEAAVRAMVIMHCRLGAPQKALHAMVAAEKEGIAVSNETRCEVVNAMARDADAWYPHIMFQLRAMGLRAVGQCRERLELTLKRVKPRATDAQREIFDHIVQGTVFSLKMQSRDPEVRALDRSTQDLRKELEVGGASSRRDTAKRLSPREERSRVKTISKKLQREDTLAATARSVAVSRANPANWPGGIVPEDYMIARPPKPAARGKPSPPELE